MALGTHGDLVTFTPAAGNPGAGVLQTGIVIGVTATQNRVVYNLGVHSADDIRGAFECVTTSVTIVGNYTQHNH